MKQLGLFISDQDIYCSMDKFIDGTVNILFITGLSGSGKSTLAKEIADKYSAIKVELDTLIYFGKRTHDKDVSLLGRLPCIADYGVFCTSNSEILLLSDYT